MRVHYYYFLRFDLSTFSFFSSHNNNNNSDNNIIMPHTSVGSYSFLCAFTSNIITNTRFFKKSINPAINTVP